jgi:predicted nucleic acid-binding protein
VPELPIVFDTTVLLYTGRIGLSDVLSVLFAPVYVPEPVLLELDMGRLLRVDTINPRDPAWATPVAVPQAATDRLPPNRLGADERAVIAHADACPGCLAGLDDRQARQLAEALGLQVVGTLGVLLRAKKVGHIPAVRPALDAAIEQGFRLSQELYQDVLGIANEAQLFL